MDNVIVLTGNMTRDPELRFTASGKGVCSFGMAVNDRKLENGNWVDGDPMFIDVSVWDPIATNLANSGLGKGTRVTVEGRLKLHTWEDNSTGLKRSRHEITANEVSVSLRFGTVAYSQATRQDRPAQPQQAPVPAGEPFGTPSNDDPFS